VPEKSILLEKILKNTIAEKEKQERAEGQKARDKDYQEYLKKQSNWFSRNWQAARDKVSSVFSPVQKKAVGGLAEVGNWSLAKSMAVITAIAVTFGLIISIYNSKGELVKNIEGQPSPSVVSEPSIGQIIREIPLVTAAGALYTGYQAYTSLVEQMGQQLIVDASQATDNPQLAIDGLRRKYNDQIKGSASSEDTWSVKLAYDYAIKHFENKIDLQKNIIRAAAENKAPGDFKKQIGNLSAVSSEFGLKNSEQAITLARKELDRIKPARDRILAWAKKKTDSIQDADERIREQIDLLEKIQKKEVWIPQDFPISSRDVSTGSDTFNKSIEEAIQFLYTQSLQ
jgi:hypothetical protein